MAEIREKLHLPPMSQIGTVVEDLDKAVEYYGSVLGLGPFTKVQIDYVDNFYYGQPVNPRWVTAFCSLGQIELEIIQPLAPPTLYNDFLKAQGEGIHHLGFDITDMDEKLALCQRIGIKVIQSGRCSNGRFAYLDTREVGGVIFELIQRKATRV